jgi:hypothetical protein
MDKKLGLSISIFGPFVLFVASLKHWYYYQHFGVSIFRFMDISEVVSLYLGDLMIVLLSGLPGVILSYYILKDKRKLNYDKRQDRFFGFIYNYLTEIYFIVSIVSYFLQGMHDFAYVMCEWFVGYELFLFFIKKITKYLRDEKKTEEYYLWVIFFMMSAVWGSYMHARYEIYEVSHKKQKYILYFSGSKLSLDDDVRFYIGNTSKYLFCSVAGYVHVYKMDDIKEMVIYK